MFKQQKFEGDNDKLALDKQTTDNEASIRKTSVKPRTNFNFTRLKSQRSFMFAEPCTPFLLPRIENYSMGKLHNPRRLQQKSIEIKLDNEKKAKFVSPQHETLLWWSNFCSFSNAKQQKAGETSFCLDSVFFLFSRTYTHTHADKHFETETSNLVYVSRPRKTHKTYRKKKKKFVFVQF